MLLKTKKHIHRIKNTKHVFEDKNNKNTFLTTMLFTADSTSLSSFSFTQRGPEKSDVWSIYLLK